MDCQIDYTTPRRDLCPGKSSGVRWNLSVPDGEMHHRSEYIFRLDPMLDYDSIASLIIERYGNFSCRFCYSHLVWDGKNGSGTDKLLCRKCSRKMSLYNMFDLLHQRESCSHPIPKLKLKGRHFYERTG